jgi:two-component system, NtrC family, sensor kinase
MRGYFREAGLTCYDALSWGEDKAMKRRSKAGGKTGKARRRKAAAVMRRSSIRGVPAYRPPTTGQETETARLTRELDEALERQAATSDVLNAIANSPNDAQPVFDMIAKSAGRLCKAQFCYVFRFDGELVHFAAQYGAVAPELFRTGYPLPPGRTSAATRSILNGAIEQIPDILLDPDYGHRAQAKKLTFRSIVAVPMLKDGRPLGTIAVAQSEPGLFPSWQIDLLRTFAAQAVIAIENTRLLSELRHRTDDLSESLEQQTATSEVLGVISSSPGELEPVFQAMLENATRICDAKFGSLFRFDGEKFHFTAEVGMPLQFVEFNRRRSPFRARPGAMLDRVRRTKQVSHTADAVADAVPGASVTLGGARSLVGVPMLKDDVLIGVINIYRREVRPFTNKQIELVQNFAAQAVIAIENTRLLSELRHRTDDLSESLEQQTATSEVLGVISSSPGALEPVFDAMLENAIRLCDAKTGNLFLYDGEEFRTAALHGASPAYADARRRTVEVRHTHPDVPLTRLTRTKDLIHIADIRMERSYIEGDPTFSELVDVAGARTLLLVPMLKENELVGAFAIYRVDVRPFTDKQIALVQNFAAQAVIAIENARLLNELRQRTADLTESLEQQTGTSEILRVISSSPTNVQPVLDTIVKTAVSLCNSYDAVILLREQEELRIAAHHGPMALDFERLPLGRDFVSGRTVIDGVPVHVPDFMAAGAEFPRGREVAKRLRQRTVLGLPLQREGQTLGCLFLRRTEVLPFTDKQIELLTTFADQAVIAIENVRLFEAEQQRTRELSESLEQQTATSEVLKVISSSPGELVPVFQAILENATHICEAKFATLWIAEPGGLRAVALHNAPPAFAEARRQSLVPPGQGTAISRVQTSKEVIQVADLAADPAYAQGDPLRVALVDLVGARTLVVVPMLKENDLVGAINIYRQEVRPFTDKQIELLTNFAAQAVIAIENARLLNELRRRTEELTASLHDLRTAQDRLVQTEKLASLGQLTAGIAHEIKNPLNFVNNFSGVSVELIDELKEAVKHGSFDDQALAEVTELTGTLRDNLDKIVQHGKRADSIVKNMLLHSREGSGERRSVDVNALVEESLNLAYHGARAEKQGFNVSLERSFDPSAGEIDAFPQEITRVLLNVITNGFYAATKRQGQEVGNGFEPTIAATTKSLDDRVEIRIRDNGTGIPPEVREKMFNPFFTTKPAGEGTGLGLSISHDIIVKQHSGSMEVDTKPGEFTEFRIILPRSAS